MKKLLIAICFMLGFAGVISAQTVTKKTDKAAAAKTATAAAPLKKDGTPDKRYKQGKGTAAAAVPLKKDGTPDKRYKVNKKG